tara:strand:+ start:171 stop:875 length:705 start_codon:yes stop_codon:yes gene_type:complete
MISTKLIPDDYNFNGVSLITGFHGIGSTGYLAIKHIIQTLNLNRVAILDHEHSPPLSSIKSGRIVTPFEIYKSQNLAFLRIEVPPLNNNENIFFREICELIISKRFKEVILIGGLDSVLKTDNTTFRYVKTESYTLPAFFNNSIQLENDRLIIGPVAQILNFMEIKNFPTFCILPYASSTRIDPRAASEAIKLISQIFNFDIEIESLLTQAEKIELTEPAVENTSESKNPNIYT